jgi:hypothetical protein
MKWQVMVNIKIICDRNIDPRQICNKKMCDNCECDVLNCLTNNCERKKCNPKCTNKEKNKCIKSYLQKGRTCFWMYYQRNKIEKKESIFIDHDVEFISVADVLSKYFKEDNLQNGDPHINKKKSKETFTPFLPSLFSIKNTDIIIINWDAVNKDPVYGSDKAFSFFDAYKNAMQSWVEDGGILILESQSHAWKLVQDSYCIFDSDVIVSNNKGPNQTGQIGIINRQIANNHPILEGIQEEYIEINGNLHSERWFPKPFPIKSDPPFIQACDPKSERKRLYFSWFEKYSNDWDPVIFTYPYNHHDKKTRIPRIRNWAINRGIIRSKKQPILLCKVVRNNPKSGERHTYGAYILTTMYLGSCGHEKLLTNLLSLDRSKLEKYYHGRRNFRVIKSWVKAKSTSFWIFLIVYVLSLYYVVFQIEGNNDIKTVLIALLVGIFGTLIARFLEKTMDEQMGGNS